MSAPEAGHARLDFALHRPRRHRGVDGVAAGLEDPHAGFGRERMAGGDHAVLRDDGRPPADVLRGRCVSSRDEYATAATSHRCA